MFSELFFQVSNSLSKYKYTCQIFANRTSHRSPDEELQIVEVLGLKKKKMKEIF